MLINKYPCMMYMTKKTIETKMKNAKMKLTHSSTRTNNINTCSPSSLKDQNKSKNE